MNYYKLRDITDNFILLKNKTEKVFNSVISWSLWESFLVVVICSCFMGFCAGKAGIDFNIIALNNGDEVSDISIIMSIGKSIWILSSLWLLLTIIAGYINQSRNGYDDLLSNIGQVLALVYVSVLPISVFFLFSFDESIKDMLGLIFNLFLLLFYLNLSGVFIFSMGEKTARGEPLSFVYTSKRLLIKNVIWQASVFGIISVLALLYLITGAFQGRIINIGFILIWLIPMGILIFMGNKYRKAFSVPDKHSFLTTFYGYGNAFCLFALVSVIMSILYENYGNIDSTYYFIFWNIVIFCYMAMLVHKTKLVCFDTGYKYWRDNDSDVENPDVEEPDIEGKKDAKKLKPHKGIKNIIGFIILDYTIDTKNLSVYQKISMFALAIISVGILFAFGKTSIIKYVINTNLWYYDLVLGITSGVLFLAVISAMLYFVLKLFKIDIKVGDIFNSVAVSLLPFGIFSVVSLFFKADLRTLLLECCFYPFIFWSVAYLIIYYLSFKMNLKKFFAVWILNIILGVVIFYVMSYAFFFVQKEVMFKVIDCPVARVLSNIEKDVPVGMIPTIKAIIIKSEPVDLVELSVDEFFSHVSFMNKYYDNNVVMSSYLIPIRIANEVADNQKWVDYFCANMPDNIRKSSNVKDTARLINNFVIKNITESETRYPFGDAFWQDSVTTFKCKHGTKPDIAVLMIAMLRAKGIPARICTVTPDRFFNNSYALVQYYENENWIPLYPENKNVKSKKEDIDAFEQLYNKLRAKESLQLYYIHDGIIYPYNDNIRNEGVRMRTDVLPGKYMVVYKVGREIHNMFFDIRKEN